ncbi:MAG: glycosyltransferase family 4 protein [Solobacterium sp.]|nr:glycosyltransferase family 4 protein [Solobacterium sp.]
MRIAPKKLYLHSRRILIEALRKPDIRKLEPGFLCYGYPEFPTGLGESFRGMIKSMDAAGLPYQVMDFDHMPPNAEPYGINVIFCNGYDCMSAVERIPIQLWLSRYNIGHWVWELETIPVSWYKYLDLFDEFWTPSSFSAEALRRITDKPVIVVPDIPDVDREKVYSREDFGIPRDRFVFLTMYDSNSLYTRKNPMAAIKAFRNAFGEDRNGPLLIVKVTHSREPELAMLKDLAGDANVRFLLQEQTRDEVLSLIDCTDVYVSLHRAEGFGLVPAEAMKLGKPVIATGWSGNTDYMNEANACPVVYTLIPVEDSYRYFQEGRWAEADTAQAAVYMKRLYTDPVYYRSIAESAKASMETGFSYASCGAVIKERYQSLKGRFRS